MRALKRRRVRCCDISGVRVVSAMAGFVGAEDVGVLEKDGVRDGGMHTSRMIQLQHPYALVHRRQGFHSPVLLELQFDAEGEDLEAQVRVTGEGEEGLEGLVVAGCGSDVVSTHPCNMSEILHSERGRCAQKGRERERVAIPSQLPLQTNNHLPPHNPLPTLQRPRRGPAPRGPAR